MPFNEELYADLIDTHDPEFAVAQLAGCTQMGYVSHYREVGGEEVELFGQESIWTLYDPSVMEATFGAEDLKHTFVKRYGRQIRMGDPDLDATYCILTNTPAHAQTYLELPQVQEALKPIVEAGGQLSIQNGKAVVHFMSDDDDEDLDYDALLVLFAAACALEP